MTRAQRITVHWHRMRAQALDLNRRAWRRGSPIRILGASWRSPR